MVNNQAQIDRVFGALADATRRGILARLSDGEATVGQLAEPFDMSLPAISKHLRVLERAGLIARERDGRLRRCHLKAEGMEDAFDWMQRYRVFWEERLEALSAFVEGEETLDKEQ